MPLLQIHYKLTKFRNKKIIPISTFIIEGGVKASLPPYILKIMGPCKSCRESSKVSDALNFKSLNQAVGVLGTTQLKVLLIGNPFIF